MIAKPKLSMEAIDTLVPSASNPNQGDVGVIAESMDANGWYGAVLVQTSSRRILAGHHRVLAAVAAGERRVPVLWADVDDEAADRIMLVDNRSAQRASTDDLVLARVLTGLQASGGLFGTGYDADDLDGLLTTLRAAVPHVDDDQVPEVPGKPKSRLGGRYELGPHVLICGDAGKAANLPEKRALLMADPPYGMKLDTDYQAMHTSGGRSRTHRPVEGDHETYVPPPHLLECAPEQVWWGADYYRAHLPGGGSWYVWDKRSTIDSSAAYTVEDFDAVLGGHFELAWSRKSHRRVMLRYLWSGHHGMQGEDTQRRVHPTQKPVALFAALIEALTQSGDTVFDPYAGSGTTLVAAHRTGRVAHLVELDPAYCDVIRARWEAIV